MESDPSVPSGTKDDIAEMLLALANAKSAEERDLIVAELEARPGGAVDLRALVQAIREQRASS